MRAAEVLFLCLVVPASTAVPCHLVEELALASVVLAALPLYKLAVAQQDAAEM